MTPANFKGGDPMGFLKVVKVIDDKIAVIEDVILLILAIGLTILLGFQVISRYIFSFVFSWSEEIARIGMVLMTLLGVGYASRIDGKHIDVSILTDIFEKRPNGKKIALNLKRFSCIATTIFCSYIAIVIGQITIYQYQMGQHLATLPSIPLWPMYLSGTIGVGLMGIRYLIRFLESFINLNEI